MLATTSAPKPRLWFILQERVVPAIVLLYQFAGLAVLAIAPVLAMRWMALPFIGAFTEQTLIVNTVSPSRSGAWVIRKQITEFGDQLIAIDNAALHNTADMERELARHAPGDVVKLTFQDANGSRQSRQSVLQRFPLTDRFAFFYLPYLIGLVYMASSLWVFILRRWDSTGRAFSVFATSVAIALASLFDLYTTHRLTALWTVTIAISGGSLLNLGLLFPQEFRALVRHPALHWIGFLPAIILAVFALKDLYNFANPRAYATPWMLEFIFCGLAFVSFLGCTGYRLLQPPSPIVHEQSRLILLGIAASFLLLALWFFATAIFHQIYFTPLLLLPIIIFPLVNAYVILRYRLVKADYLVGRAVLYTFFTALTSLGYALIVTGLGVLLESRFHNLNSLIIGATIFVLALLVNPLRVQVQTWVDETFAKSQLNYRETLQAFSRELTQAIEIADIARLLGQYVEQNFHPAQIHVFLHDPFSDYYLATPDSSGRPTSDLRFAANSSLVQVLSNRRSALLFGGARSLPATLQSEKARLGLLGAQVFIPLPGRKKSLAGWIGLGARKSGDPYGYRDLSFLETLGDQAALALERAQVVANLERRMREMDIFTRIAQGINVTLAFDDILELIYAQTVQLVPCTDFCITLQENYSGQLYYVFYVEKNDRLNERENRLLPVKQGLEGEVVNSRQPIMTSEYERTCRSRGFLSTGRGLYAWMGVPLNAGAETIGAICLGSRDASIDYSNDQVKILQAVADQAAGAIVKAQLLKETQRRAQQLSQLNEVARSLTSTLALDPLLNQILLTAVGILNCEAGSLLLLDEATDELVFEVVVGPVANELKGKRMAPGAGLVGKTVETRSAIIANDARRTKEWYNADQQTGFTTQDLLVVPMQVKDRVIGVIEVVNKKDSLPFNEDDKDLLTALTGQAAIAIENARLYTLTDQALTARVEELSVMQRIDRELNASLNVERAMRITLSWAMRQSEMEAGLVGMIIENSLKLVASEGYQDEVSSYLESALPVAFPALRAALETSQPQARYNAAGEEGFGLLHQAKGQVAIPIRREARVIGLILLETNRPSTCPDETIAFLSRLSDHAAIAIANAQLYAAIEAANTAKSEFVSFVSHELKTPMTSIKGFTDLLAGGVVGPINETQSNFLSTIRSNVDRMSTLVSDLADVSRIEAGRLRLEFGAIPVTEIVDEVIRSVRKQIDEKQQSLSVQMPPTLPPMWGDRTRLIQILTNLMSNAYKYSPAGGKITLRAEIAENQWAAGAPRSNGSQQDSSPGPKVVHISVQDTGFGITPEDQQRIFQKFFRSEDQSIRETPGTGLGLNITKTLVEMQGGAIWFASEYRKGTTFHITVPIAETV